MPKLSIDGQTYEFEGKKSILQVALDNGVEIPHYCYHPGLSVVASCRICLAEISQPNPRNDNKVELVPKLVPTCQTPAADGMEVHLSSPKSVANQKAVMEYLLINHPLDCPVCDQAGECSLQDYSYKYGRAKSRFDETKIKQPKKNLGTHVLLYADRCIMCTRCVRFTREVTGTNEIGVFGRGNNEQIDVFPGNPLENELSGNVVDLCPVGALLDKDFLMSMRVWNLEKAASIDGITASGDNISIEYNKFEGKVYRIKPRTNMDVNTWWISDEIRFGYKFINHEDRFRSPTHKVQGTHEECDWNQAYKQVIEKYQQIVKDKGEGSLAVMVSPMLPCEEAYLLGKLALAVDPQATLAVGPVPTKGQDKTFPGGYTVLAEKAPNARGVRRALGQLSDNVIEYDDLLKQLKTGKIAATLITGNYPSDWTTPEFVEALTSGDRYNVLIDTLPSGLYEKVDVMLPGATWAEKAGTFENHKHRLQSFNQAIPVIELAKNEGQIALDLLAAVGAAERQRYDVKALRREMGDAFVTDVHHPPIALKQLTDMQYVEL
ncbi:molybdopterin-dependent oxidoreductase [Phycisphaerales bacterium AB-hyl4]|uniref:Molybdopterin-dependent oxidoreductase n=1 Tax=Natronomicrosphaera hydrolytica TaxID=3242702 RepID=A0ABV4U3Z4_9BACT